MCDKLKDRNMINAHAVQSTNVTEWFYKCENVNHTQRPSHSTDLEQAERLILSSDMFKSALHRSHQNTKCGNTVPPVKLAFDWRVWVDPLTGI